MSGHNEHTAESDAFRREVAERLRVEIAEIRAEGDASPFRHRLPGLAWALALAEGVVS